MRCSGGSYRYLLDNGADINAKNENGYTALGWASSGGQPKLSDAISRRPTEPTESECCMSGCARCVWDRNYDELERFESKVSPKT